MITDLDITKLLSRLTVPQKKETRSAAAPAAPIQGRVALSDRCGKSHIAKLLEAGKEKRE